MVDRALRGRHDIRLESVEFAQHDIGTEQEVAAVPEVALLDVVSSGGLVRLLDERCDVADRAAVGWRFCPDVAVARRRTSRSSPQPRPTRRRDTRLRTHPRPE